MRNFIAILNILLIFSIGCNTPEKITETERKERIELEETETVQKEKETVVETPTESQEKKASGIMGAFTETNNSGNTLGMGGLGTRGTGMGGGSSAYGAITGTSRRALSGRASMNSLHYYQNTEQYESPEENGWKSAKADPLSTFSIDVDTASYSNIRRFLTNHQLPPPDAVRIEEMINYFNYDYPEPKNSNPVRISTWLTSCPWNSDNKIMKIGIKGKPLEMKKAPSSNLVFLIDVSGSMNSYNKLPLLKQSFKLLVNNLRKEDLVSIVVYAGRAGKVLDPTPGDQKDKIIEAIESLVASGSTAGGEGIKLAYKLAENNFIKGGNNRVVLATDGDFNVGISSDNELAKLIEEEREKGVFLTVLGYGMGNYKDAKMEKLANKGNGNFAYIDNLLEAKKVLVNEMSGTLFTIAKDVKIQVEFNPAVVSGYRLIGYENRMLKKEDFNNDKKDAGEIGAGHTVTALYEIIPAGTKNSPVVDDLKYQQVNNEIVGSPDETATVKVRYKLPDGDKSRLVKHIVKTETYTDYESAGQDTRFTITVAMAGMLMKNSKEPGAVDWDFVIKEAKRSRGKDEHGYRAEFIKLVEKTQLISSVK